MRNQVEDQIRDLLAKNLAIIEPGLRLIGVNYHLRNDEGASGFVDILARDSTNLITIIELKRSDSSAREAMHEIAKYVDLLSRDKALPKSKIRAIVASTTWHELLVPFSYYASTVDFPLEGYSLDMDTDGITVLDAHRIEALSAPDERTLTWHQRWIPLTPDKDVAHVWNEIREELSKLGIFDFVGLHLEGERSKQAIVLCLGTIQDTDRRAEFVHLLVSQGLFDEDDLKEEATEQLALMALSNAATGISFNICYPEKINSMVFLHRWILGRWFREGIFNDQAGLFQDQELLDMVQGWSGLGQSTYSGRARPQNSSQWDKFEQGIRLALAPNLPAQLIVDGWLEEHGDNTGKYDVVAQIYNPSDMLNSLVHGLDNDNFDRLVPKFQLAFDGSS
ncbi:endonuclease NucS domain-containing protein [Arthrobacter subterraneus]|nr:endonuclease NucS domain-containing protein [Arthrobacter subterraneus]